MSEDAARVLAELRQDHRNMAILLNLLQKEVDHVAHEDDTADFERMQDIMRYMNVYPDAVHHPREDLIYNDMRQKRPDLADGLEAVEDDHKAIADFSKRLLADIDACVAGEFVTRKRVLEDAMTYVDRLRKHMTWEERDLFERAESMLGELDVDTTTLDALDPVFGPDKDESFSGLFQTINRMT